MRQLGFDLSDLRSGFRSRERVRHRFEVGKLVFARGDQFRQFLFGGFCLAVFLVVFLRIFVGRQRGVGGDAQGIVIIIIIDYIVKRRALLQAVEVGGDQLRLDAQLLAVGALFQFAALQVEFLCRTLDEVGDEFLKLGGILFRSLQAVALIIK